MSFGRKGVGPGEFDSPRGLAVDKHGILYACDYYRFRTLFLSHRLYFFGH